MKNLTDRERISGVYLPYRGAEYKLTYYKEERGISITGIADYTSKEKALGQLVIPAEIHGVAVKRIGRYAFSSCSGFTGSLVIPYGVESVDAWAFYGCSGFDGSLDIPDSIVEIGDSAFADCTGFRGQLVISPNIQFIGDYAFSDCSGFTGRLVIPENIKEIGRAAFYGCSGFTGSLELPRNVMEIGEDAFSNCSGLSELPLYKTKYCLRYLVEKDGIIITGIKNYKSLDDLGELVIPEEIDGMAVRAVSRHAFDGCTGFHGRIVVPQGITEIDMVQEYD